ncbi:DegV family protein [Peloplasma aerotolerans]|uniref:DegV family protein n=1 Tax=Peloplasma aerotolerans TaxID=3044389 RepID=A0AAW6U7X6_9MOLU|nr:DegV family protein [Mariniplasma sp. M4Ah]MDI6453040.1 DegV family protein [Mariniplasma sp. M4Ah]MDR4969057.1 DegV family protein [Acholeplasmataceae bacterium]
MEKRIVIDTSTGGLDYYPVEHGIEILRIKIYIDGKEYEDGSTLKADQFYDMLKNDKDLLPKTSQPSVGEVMALFQKYLDEGVEEILVVTISAKMSGTYNSCIMAAQEFEDKLKIKVFDSKTVCFSEGIFALEAKRMIDEGFSLEAVENRLNNMIYTNTIYFAVNSLSYLVKNGRLSNAKGYIGKLLDIKPVLQVKESGEIVSIGNRRTIKSVLLSITALVKEYVNNQPYQAYLIYTGNPNLKQYFVSIIKDNLGLENLYESPSTPVVGAHVGPDVIGIGIFLNDDENLNINGRNV